MSKYLLKWKGQNLLCLIILLLFLFPSCTQTSINNNSFYSLEVTLDVNLQTVHVKAEIFYPLVYPLDSIQFIAHEKLNISRCDSDNLMNYTERSSGNKAKLITLNYADKIEDYVNVEMEYNFELKQDDAPWGIDKISQEWIELSLNSGWLPIISTYDNDFEAIATLEVLADQQMEITSSGKVKSLGFNKFELTNEVPQIDFVLIGSPKFKVFGEDEFEIYSIGIDEDKNTFIRELGLKSQQWLNEKFSEIKTLPPVKIVVAPRNESGYARKNFIVLSSDISTEDTIHYVNYITHELAHFWSSGANPLTAHRWLDESIAEFLAWKYVGIVYSEKSKDDFYQRSAKEAETLPPVYVKGHQESPIHAVMYRKGVLKLHWLEEQIGEQQMQDLLMIWFERETKDTEVFLDCLKRISGERVVDLFKAELSK